MMFGFKRKKKSEVVQWPHLQALLEDDDQRAAVERLFPNAGRESFLTSLRRIDPKLCDDIVSLGRQVFHGAKLAEYPTLAVAGMLNSGKTSVVASMLSPSGRARTLRGVANRYGTHRFVLWMPQRWKDQDDLWNLLLDDFGNAVGHAPESLSEDPQEAHQQYNNRAGDADALGVPLVATDPALDRLGIGLLDCPDIVSDEVFGVGSPERRRELLGRAATFCSAFLIVSTPNMARDKTLGEILQTVSDLMPGIPRLLAVNRVRPGQEPEDILDSFAPQSSKFGVERIYAAYDFEIPKSDPYIPKTVRQGDQIVGIEQHPDDPVPVFYSIETQPDQNPPAEIEASRLLSHLTKELDCPESFDRFLRGRMTALRRSVWETSLKRLKEDCRDTETKSDRARKTILETTISLFTKRSPGGSITEIRMHQSKRIVKQLTDAFCDSAPWYARLGVRINTFVQKRAKAATELISRYAPTALAENYAESIKEKFKAKKVGHLVAPDDLDTSLRRYGAPLTLTHWFGEQNDPLNTEKWDRALEDVLRSFDANDRVQFDGEKLQKVAEEMWNQVPRHKKLAFGLTPLAAMLATFGSILMLPFDFGSSVIANASIVELLAAAGLTAFSAYWAGGKSAQVLTTQAAIEQMSMFYVLLCHHLGVDAGDPLPTIELKQQTYQLPEPNLSAADADESTPEMPVYRINESFIRELQDIMPA